MAERYGAGLVTVRSWVRIPLAAAVHQCQLSVPSLRGRLMSTSVSINRHTTCCASPVSVVLQLRLVSGWGLQETEISAAPWALEARERTLLFYCCSIISDKLGEIMWSFCLFIDLFLSIHQFVCSIVTGNWKSCEWIGNQGVSSYHPNLEMIKFCPHPYFPGKGPQWSKF